MARGSEAANTAANSANTLSGGLTANAGALYGALAPELEAQAAHPAGFSPTDLADMNTAAQQSAGGSEAAAVGRGSLLASRRRNAGSADAAIGEGVRTAGQNLSKAAVGTKVANTQLKERQHEAGLSGLEGLYGTNLGGATTTLGQVASNVNADTNAQNASWDWARFLLDPALQAAGGGLSAYEGAKGRP